MTATVAVSVDHERTSDRNEKESLSGEAHFDPEWNYPLADSRLKGFSDPDLVPECQNQIRRILNSPHIRLIRNFALGPSGTNIEQASQRWLREMGIAGKAVTCLCKTPEESILKARTTREPGELAIFWTCAVFIREHEVFFRNPDLFPFFSEIRMGLDAMQLATRPEQIRQMTGNRVPEHWKILSHPSPAPLVTDLAVKIVNSNSNSEAAVRCKRGEADACITTQLASEINGLVTLHPFGSPRMVFFAGITEHGARFLNRVWKGVRP